jgi:inward rectifier potassium channel
MPTETFRPPGEVSYSIRVIGARRAGLRDAYHALLRMAWWRVIALIALVFLLLNAIFALLYLAVGGVANARPGSFLDAFYFSVQTMGTIGYGSMFPASTGANNIVVLESIVGLLITALATGLVFVRFSLTRPRVVFGRYAAIGPMDGEPTLMIRLGNDRSSQIYDARMRLMLMTTNRSPDGEVSYRTTDLALMRDRLPALARSWTILHRLDERSPLRGQSPESLARVDAEILVAISGIDDTSLQSVNARWTYEHTRIVWGARLADVLSETPEGDILLDLTRFHEIVPTTPSENFPWPRQTASSP